MTALLLFLSAGVLGGGETPAAFVAEPANVDRGELKAGAPLTQAFKLTNLSTSQSVEIVGLKVSCGCAKATFDREKLKPGETATFTVSINTLAQADGPWSWMASVRYKCAGETEATLALRLTGKLVREVTLSPPGLAFSLESGSISQSVTLTDSRTASLTVKGVSASASFLSATLNPGDKPGQTRIAVTLAENAPLGEHNETIVLATSDPTYPELRVPVRVSKRSPARVKAYPAELVLTEPSPSHQVSLRRQDGQPLKISKCEIDDGNVALKWPDDAGITALVKLKIPDATWSKSGKATLRITLADPAGDVVIVPVEWNRP